ncbi:glycosyltransferase [Candidatus Sumerlaeota bacterium]|nr:glycosyltransferase [Candidatus Sumerlaeota bacterium]
MSKKTMKPASEPQLSVIVPVYNEVVTVLVLLEKVRDIQIDKQVIVVDDCSTDGSRQLLQDHPELYDQLVLRETNGGKGVCVKEGLRHATGEFVIFQDADLEYEPQEYYKLLEPLAENRADVVFGSRFWSGQPHRVLYYRHSLGNRLLTTLSNWRTDLNLTDMMTGYKMIRRSTLENIEIEECGFAMEAELVGKLAARKLIFYEVGVKYYGRSYEEGKKTTWRDGLRALWAIWKYGQGRYKDVGAQTLHKLIGFDDYNREIFKHVEPHLGRNIMEAGSGIGSLAPLMRKFKSITLTDVSDYYLDVLSAAYKRDSNIHVRKYDLMNHDPEFEKLGIDTIVTSNVLEHIENDEQALHNFFKILKPGGRAVILVPAHMALYSDLDKNLEHFRRYGKADLTGKLRSAGFEIERVKYFNAVGAIGWWVSGKLFRAGEIAGHHVSMQKILMPISRLVDAITGPPFGLSVIVVARKPE